MSDQAADASKPGDGPNRRRRMRFPSEGETVELVVQATMADESYSGIGVLLEAGWDVAPGTTISLKYLGATMTGTVRASTPVADGRRRIGVEWNS